jgi:hypothetical protein
MTDAQLEVLSMITPAYLMEQITFKAGVIGKALSAKVRLPHTNERGDSVMHGCNLIMHGVVDYMFQSFMSDLNVLRYKIPTEEYYELLETFNFEWGKGTAYPVLKNTTI